MQALGIRMLHPDMSGIVYQYQVTFPMHLGSFTSWGFPEVWYMLRSESHTREGKCSDAVRAGWWETSPPSDPITNQQLMGNHRKLLIGFRTDGSNAASQDQQKFPKIPNWWDISGGADSLDGAHCSLSALWDVFPNRFRLLCNHITLQTHLRLPISSLHAFRPLHNSHSWVLTQASLCSHIAPSKALKTIKTNVLSLCKAFQITSLSIHACSSAKWSAVPKYSCCACLQSLDPVLRPSPGQTVALQCNTLLGWLSFLQPLSPLRAPSQLVSIKFQLPYLSKVLHALKSPGGLD